MNVESFVREFGQSLTEPSVFSLLLASLAGIIATGVCPCTLPVGFGIAGFASSNTEHKSNVGFKIAFAFFLGIVVCLSIFGALAGKLGIFLSEAFGQYWSISMAIVSAIAAVFAFYGPRIKVDKLAKLRRPGVKGSFLYGLIFSLGTSAAPLILLLSVAAATANPLYGFLLAMFFGIGRGLPFLIVGIFASAIAKFTQLTWLRKSIQIVSGVALLFVSYYYLNVFIRLQ